MRAAQSLTRFPYRGRVGQRSGTRELVVSPLPYVIVYEVGEDTVNISRVLHGAQDWPGQKRLR
jgi:toxin ParE1/3/4